MGGRISLGKVPIPNEMQRYVRLVSSHIEVMRLGGNVK
jgi:hypothetical protein